MSEHIEAIVAVLFSLGGFYWLTNYRLANLEKKVDGHNELKDTITRLDERVKLLIDHFIKQN